MGPGTVLGGRYALRQRLDDGAAVSRWQAHDQTLDRLVTVQAIAAEHPHAPAALDAARRAAGVEDPRLVRVLDVGRDPDVSIIVTEWVGGTTLARRLHDGPMPAEEVRTLLGEASLALSSARRRGLHHLALTPDVVHLGEEDDTVKVAGVAVQAALAGYDSAGADADADTARDTVALVALAYAGLTGYWPLPGRVSLPGAPTVGGRPVPPSEIVSGVPTDLDTLCAQTFAGAGAPSDPAEVAAQIAPWGQARRPVRATGAFAIVLPRPAPSAASGGSRSNETIVLPGEPAAAQVSKDVASDRLGGVRAMSGRAKAAAAVTVAGAGATSAAVKTAAAKVASTGSTAAVKAAATKVAAATATAVRQPRFVGDPAAPGAAAGGDVHDVLFDDGLEPPAPLLAPAPVRRPPENQTRTVLVLVGGFVAVFFLLAYCGLRGLGDNAFVAQPPRTGAPTVAPTPAATASPTASATASAATSATPTDKPTPVRIVDVTGFDPEGDRSERDSFAGRATDGDPSTSWTSETYRSAGFGGLKEGVGLQLDLGEPTQVQSVTVDVGGSGSALQLRSATGRALGGDSELADTSVVAEEQDVSGTVTLRPKSPVTTRYLVLWFTAPTQSGSGYWVEVAEVAVS